jgi:hypothetical protein
MRRLREDLLKEQSLTSSVDFFEQFVMLKESDIQPNSWNEVRWTGYQNGAETLKSAGPITTTLQIVAGDEGSVSFLGKSTIDIAMTMTLKYIMTYDNPMPPTTKSHIFVCPKSAASLISDI